MRGLCGLIIRSEAWPSVDAGAATAFIEATDPGVIFLRGAGGCEAETLAVMLRELRREMVGLLRVAVGRPAAEMVLQRRLGLAYTPGLAWVGGGDVLVRRSGAQAWSDITHATDTALAMLSRRHTACSP